MAFIERGKPVFIDKPMVGNVADCRKLIELEKRGAIILGSSSVRYCNEVRQYLSLPEEKKGKALLDQIYNRLEGKPHCLAGIEDLTDSIKVLLAGKCSRESAGAMVGIDSPALETVHFDGDAFEKEYAANARPMYL